MGNENTRQETSLHDMEKTIVTLRSPSEWLNSNFDEYTVITYGGRSAGRTYLNNRLIESQLLQMTFKTELQMQAYCCQWYWNEFRFTSAKLCLHTNMNNSFNRIEGARNKSLGVIKGVSDIEFIDYGIVWFLEFKIPGGSQSPEQREFQRMVETAGMGYKVIFSFEEFQNFIRNRIALWNTGK